MEMIKTRKILMKIIIIIIIKINKNWASKGNQFMNARMRHLQKR
jgi:hypothetical protein